MDTNNAMQRLKAFWPPYCATRNEEYGGHWTRIEYAVVDEPNGAIPIARFLRPIFRKHFTDPAVYAAQFDALGDIGTADYVRTMMPTNHRVRFGDLGELMLSEFLEDVLLAEVPLKRLRNKPNPELALHGTDGLGLIFDGDHLIVFKGEAKGRGYLQPQTTNAALVDLRRNNGRPPRHVLFAAMSAVDDTRRERIRQFVHNEGTAEVRHVFLAAYESIVVGLLDRVITAAHEDNPLYVIAFELEKEYKKLVAAIYVEAGAT